MLLIADIVILAIILVVALVLTEVLRPKPKFEDARPSGIGDFRVPTATEGRVIPLLWGRARIDGPNVVWYGDVYQQKRTKYIRTGLTSGSRVTLGFKNFVAFQQALCRGPDVALRGAWIDDKPVYSGNITGVSTFNIDDKNLFGGDELGNGGFQATIEFYPGTTSQAVSNYLDTAGRQQISAPSPTAPRYTGTCYIVARGIGSSSGTLNSAYIGNSTTVPILAVDVERFPATFSGQGATDNKIGTDGDCNPINVIYEVLTNTEWGLGRSPSDIDTGVGSSFLEASDTMITEENGFSMILDRALVASDLFQEIERQIGGMVYRDLFSGKWKIKLARDDYVLASQPLVDESNSELVSYIRSGWEDTTNQVQVLFNKRDDDYKESYALAQDLANAIIQGDGTIGANQIVSAQMRFPGVKSSQLAADLAWRELRTMSYPLARAELKVDRSFYAIQLNSVIRWSNSTYGVVEMPMRVTSIDYGTLQDNAITLGCVQDIFYYAPPSFGIPQPTSWTAPTFGAVAFPAADQVIMSAPRAIMRRSNPGATLAIPDSWYWGFTSPPLTTDAVWVGATRQGYEQGFRVYVDGRRFADVDAFFQYGTLVSSVAAQQANPAASIQIYASAQLADFFGDLEESEIGTSLAQLVMVDNEFWLVRGASYSTGTGILTLTNVYRGALDSVQKAHSAGARVKCLFIGGDLVRYTSNPDYLYWTRQSATDTVELRMYRGDSYYTGAVTSVNIIGNDFRAFRPNPPSAIRYNGSGVTFTTPSLEGAGSGLNGFRIDVNWWRKDYNSTDEAAAVTGDATPTVTTEYRLEVRADPAGANTLVGSISAYTTGTGALQVLRTDIITAAAAGTLLRFKLRARHTNPDTGAVLESLYDFEHDVTPSSSLTGQFYFGGGIASGLFVVGSAQYTAAATGTFTVNIGAAQATANIEYRIGLGAWTTVIAAGATTGTFSATTGDLIRVRRTVNEAPNPQFVELRNPSSVAVAYGTFQN
jgi:hypothetical protein